MSSFAGIGNLSHDVNNCPRRNFTSADGQSRLDCDYDYQGRRYTKKVSIQGSVTSHERYLYRGYLQIAAFDMLNSQALIRRILWDPKEPSATRPLALLQDGKLHNYRHYNPRDGRWINRDLIAEQGGWNLYGFVSNSSSLRIESLGLTWDNVADSVLNGIFYAVEVSVNQAGDILASALGYGSQAEIINQLDQPVGNSETHRGDWIDAIQDAGDWLKGETPANTDYGVNSDTSYAIKNATQGKELIMQFLKNNKNAKKCLEWQK